MSDRIDRIGANGFQVGACYGRYRRWTALGESEAYDQEDSTADQQNDLPLVLQFEACGREDIRVGFAMPLPPRPSAAQDEDEQDKDDDNKEKEDQDLDAIREEKEQHDDSDADMDAEETAIKSDDQEDQDQDDRGKDNENTKGKELASSSRRQPTGWVYELGIGSNGNTEILWRKNIYSSRRGVPPKEITLLQLFTGRTCSETDFIKYWVVIHENTLAFGIGDTIGQDLVAKCVDTPEQFKSVARVAFSSWKFSVGFRNISFKRQQVPLDLAQLSSRQIVREDPYGTKDLLTESQRKEYLQACEQAKKRVDRFGGEYHAPDIKQFVDSKIVRQLQRAGSVGTHQGFVTGFDITCDEEKAKRAKRMERFQTPQFGVEFSKASAQAMQQEMTQDQWQQQQEEQAKLVRRAQKFGGTTDSAKLKLDATKWKELLRPATEKVLNGRRDVDWSHDAVANSQKQANALHLYCLDDQFQQVRTKDILEYFVGYGPSYVEWLDNYCCTVVFHETHTASRALIAMSEVIPVQHKIKPLVATSSNDQDGDETMKDDTADAAVEKEQQVQEEEDHEEEDTAFNGSNWRFATPIKTTNSMGASREWRVLLREATLNDFPAEKQHKRYHQRSSSGAGGSHHRFPSRRDNRKRRHFESDERPNKRSR